jgi:hypothetical protein
MPVQHAFLASVEQLSQRSGNAPHDCLLYPSDGSDGAMLRVAQPIFAGIVVPDP